MLVFKFGGASVKSADAVRNIVSILEKYNDKSIVVVVSAMGKTTNALERLIEAYVSGNTDEVEKEFNFLKSYHEEIASGLFGKEPHDAHAAIECLLDQLKLRLEKEPTLNYDYDYDQ